MEIQHLVRQEMKWLKVDKQHNFILVLFTKLAQYEHLIKNKDSAYNSRLLPMSLTMPYICRHEVKSLIDKSIIFIPFTTKNLLNCTAVDPKTTGGNTTKSDNNATPVNKNKSEDNDTGGKALKK
jgi:hypothetical protein